MHVLLIGGIHLLQASIVTELRGSGHVVSLGVDEQARLPAVLAAQVDPVPLNQVAAALNGCDAAIVLDPSLAWTWSHQQARIDLVHAALGAIAAADPRPVIRVSDRRTRVAPPRAGRPDERQLRTTLVYGVADDPITLFLILMRSLPVVPLLDRVHQIRPVWHEDLAAAVVKVLNQPGPHREISIAGPEVITQETLYERVAAVIDRQPLRVPIPEFLATHGMRLQAALGARGPFGSYLSLVDADEGGLIAESAALDRLLGRAATPLETGLRRLVRDLAEQPPAAGVGRMEMKRFSADISSATVDAAGLMDLVRERFKDVMPVPVGVESEAGDIALIEGAVLTMALPGRGHVPVRVEEVTDQRVVLVCLRGHLLAGAVRFTCQTLGPGVLRFEVLTCDRAANALDWVALTIGGSRLQDANWKRLVENVVALSGGETTDVERVEKTLSPAEAASIDEWIQAVVDRHQLIQASAEQHEADPGRFLPIERDGPGAR